MRVAQRRFCRGFNLTELAIVLGVVAAVMAGLWSLIQTVQQTTRLRQTTEQVINIVKNVRGFYLNQTCIPNGNQMAVLLLAPVPIFPREMLDGANVTHLWNGAVTVAGSDPGCAHRFMLTLTNVPAATCAQLVPQLTAPGEISRGLTGATINGSNAALQTLPPNPSAIIGTGDGQCGNGATTITLTYRLRLTE